MTMCNLMQACEWVAFGWKPMTAEDEFMDGRIRPRQPFVDINVSKKVATDWENYKQRITEAGETIKNALRDQIIVVRGKHDMSMQKLSIKNQFTKGEITEEERDEKLEKAEKEHETMIIISPPPVSFAEDPNYVIVADDLTYEEFDKIPHPGKTKCRQRYIEQMDCVILPFAIKELGGVELSFYTNGKSLDVPEYHQNHEWAKKRYSYYDLEFSFPALEKAFPYKKPNIKERLDAAGYSSPYLEMMLEIIEEEKIDENYDVKSDNLKGIIKKKMEKRLLPESQKIVDAISTMLRPVKAQKGGAKPRKRRDD